MEDDINFSGNGRRPQFFRKWKTTSFFQKKEDDLNFRIWKRTSIFRIWKRTSIVSEMKDNFKFSENGRPLHFNISYC
jgi:hypothetical protein